MTEEKCILQEDNMLRGACPPDRVFDEEKDVTEVSIAPDGRIFVFGISRQMLEICEKLNFNSPDLKKRLIGLHEKNESQV
jgi:hypothetical protein